ncbi:MAG: 50S ribosomal protein L3 [Chloroflexi bacterium]|nr:50S ribosomal protein L3 [Chloroflexota bacterium]
MVEGLLGTKLGMTQIFDDRGEVTPVTVIAAGPCVVTQIKTKATDGYEAVQLGFGAAKRLTQPERGHLQRSQSVGQPERLLKHLREVSANDLGELTIGQEITVSIFQPGDIIDISGVSKGKGFAGVVKRHHFRGGPKTHGQSDRWRAPGSIGAGTTPGRVYKGTRMAGRMGNERVTVQNLRVVRVDEERNLLLVKGSVPGANESVLLIRRAVKSGRGRS